MQGGQLEFACAAAALTCTTVGARGGIEPVENIERLMATSPRRPGAYDLSSLRRS